MLYSVKNGPGHITHTHKQTHTDTQVLLRLIDRERDSIKQI